MLEQKEIKPKKYARIVMYDDTNHLVDLNVGIPEKSSLILGNKVGLIQNIYEHYPTIANLRDVAFKQAWRWDEIDMTPDIDQVNNPDFRKEVDILIETLSFQAAGDSLAARGVSTILRPIISSNALEGLCVEWERQELVHGLTYSEILRVVFADRSTELLNYIAQNKNALQRALYMGKIFNETYVNNIKYEMGSRNYKKNHIEEIKRLVVKYFTVMLCLEAISFKASFASTFMLVETTGAFTRIGKNIQLIAKDELLHSEFSREIIRLLKEDKEWRDVFNDDEVILFNKFAISTILGYEYEWSRNLFSNGRTMIGLNANILQDYTGFCARYVYDSLEYPYCDPVRNVKSNPLPELDRKWFCLDLIQTASQEIPINNYRLNSVRNNLSNNTKFEYL